MNKPSNDASRGGTSLLRTLSGPLRDILSTINAPAGFFLSLNPDQFEVRFLGIHSAKADPHAARVLWEIILQESWPPYLETGKDVQDALFQIISSLCEMSGLSWGEIQGAAVHWLETGGVNLGNTTISQDGKLSRVEHWSLTKNTRPLIRFQDALDWAATYRFNLDQLKSERADTQGYEELGPTVLKIPMPAVRNNLVVRDNLHIFLAEHIISLNGSVDLKNRCPKQSNWSQTFYMFPIRGLGQWRAAINWIEAGLSNEEMQKNSSLATKIKQQASALARAAIEEMFTLSLINDFALSAEECFAVGGPTLAGRQEKLTTAFARLWWAKDIRFYKRGASVDRLERSPNGSLCKVAFHISEPKPIWQEVSKASCPQFLSWTGDSHPGEMHVRLHLGALVSAREDEMAVLTEIWPFDEIVYHFSLFQADEKELQRLSDLLEQRLRKIIVEQVLQAKVIKSERAEVYEGCAHWLKDSIGITGWQDSLQSLGEITSTLSGVSSQIHKAENSLALFSILEGAASLLRLNGILDRKDYQKLEHWFDEESLEEWKVDKAFDIYQKSIVHLTRSIAGALGRPLVNVTVNGKTVLYDGDCMFSMSFLRFPPLSKALTNEPIFALLPGFLEPLINGLRFLKNSNKLNEEQRRNEPIRLMIEDHRTTRNQVDPPHILVRVGNISPMDERIVERAGDLTRITQHSDPTGVQTTRLLVRRTHLATIKKTEWAGGYRWTPVLLHPQELHRRIFSDKPTAQAKTNSDKK